MKPVARDARAFWLREPGVGEIRPAPLEEPGPGEVLVAPVLGGISGTDMQLYRGSRARNDVQILCHEFSAQVVATGQGVSSVHAGDRADRCLWSV